MPREKKTPADPNAPKKPRTVKRSIDERLAAMRGPIEKQIEMFTKKRENAEKRVEEYTAKLEQLQSVLDKIPA